MRAREFLNEFGIPKMRNNVANASRSVHLARDPDTVDRIYHLNRIGMAMGMADGKSRDPVDMDESSWAEKYNTIHPYTQEEENMFYQAMATIGTKHKIPVSDRRSLESEEIHKVSPVKEFKGYGK